MRQLDGTDDDRAAAGEATEWDARYLLRRWQRFRCAMCGYMDRLELDHDHDTGLIRGWLCVACNHQEPDAEGAFTAYREMPPAAMLGITARYHSPVFGWAEPAPPPPPLHRDPSYLVAEATTMISP